MDLKKLRTKHKMTQRQFADLIGYTEGHYACLERSTYTLTPKAKKLITETLRNYTKAFK
jgi:transcriptional regulator with XRE-family HTH domain